MGKIEDKYYIYKLPQNSYRIEITPHGKKLTLDEQAQKIFDLLVANKYIPNSVRSKNKVIGDTKDRDYLTIIADCLRETNKDQDKDGLIEYETSELANLLYKLQVITEPISAKDLMETLLTRSSVKKLKSDTPIYTPYISNISLEIETIVLIDPVPDDRAEFDTPPEKTTKGSQFLQRFKKAGFNNPFQLGEVIAYFQSLAKSGHTTEYLIAELQTYLATMFIHFKNVGENDLDVTEEMILDKRSGLDQFFTLYCGRLVIDCQIYADIANLILKNLPEKFQTTNITVLFIGNDQEGHALLVAHQKGKGYWLFNNDDVEQWPTKPSKDEILTVFSRPKDKLYPYQVFNSRDDVRSIPHPKITGSMIAKKNILEYLVKYPDNTYFKDLVEFLDKPIIKGSEDLWQLAGEALNALLGPFSEKDLELVQRSLNKSKNKNTFVTIYLLNILLKNKLITFEDFLTKSSVLLQFCPQQQQSSIANIIAQAIIPKLPASLDKLFELSDQNTGISLETADHKLYIMIVDAIFSRLFYQTKEIQIPSKYFPLLIKFCDKEHNLYFERFLVDAAKESPQPAYRQAAIQTLADMRTKGLYNATSPNNPIDDLKDLASLRPEATKILVSLLTRADIGLRNEILRVLAQIDLSDLSATQIEEIVIVISSILRSGNLASSSQTDYFCFNILNALKKDRKVIDLMFELLGSDQPYIAQESRNILIEASLSLPDRRNLVNIFREQQLGSNKYDKTIIQQLGILAITTPEAIDALLRLIAHTNQTNQAMIINTLDPKIITQMTKEQKQRLATLLIKFLDQEWQDKYLLIPAYHDYKRPLNLLRALNCAEANEFFNSLISLLEQVDELITSDLLSNYCGQKMLFSFNDNTSYQVKLCMVNDGTESKYQDEFLPNLTLWLENCRSDQPK